ncbi:hypothetical protein JCM14469_16960 [Desulfatiferula olefinivorans]
MKTPRFEGESQGIRNGGSHDLSAVIAGLLKARETRGLVADVVPDIVEAWAGQNRLKRKIADQIEGFVRKKMNGHGPGVHPGLAELMQDAAFTGSATRFLPSVLTVTVEALNALTDHLETAGEEDRKRFVSELLDSLAQSRLGDSVSVILKTLNRCYEENPAFLSEKLAPALIRRMEELDFGEIRDFLDLSAGDIGILVKTSMDTLYRYPSKLVLGLSFIADIVNSATFVSAEFLAMTNKISPDLLTDVVLSIFRKVDGKKTARLLNQVSEIVRKLHTGSALLGDPGTSRLPADLIRFLEDFLSVFDGELMWKAKVAFEEEKEIVARVFYQVMKENPERLERRIIRYSSLKNAQIRALLHHMSAMTRLPEKDVADAAEKGLTAVETQDLAEVVNLLFLFINKISDLKPDLIPGLVTSFVDALDLYEVSDGLSLFFETVGEALMPLERVLVPKAVKHLCAVLEPQDDDYEQEAAEARAMLRTLLLGDEEVVS